MAKIKVRVSTNKIGSRCETILDEPNWDLFSDQEKEETCRDAMYDMINWDYEVLE